MIFLAYIELLLFAICAFTVFYLLVYAIAATGNRTDKYSESRVKHRFAILIPAYQDDDYIPYTVKSFLQQEYPITRVRDKDCVKNRVKRAKIVRFTLC